MTDVFASYSTGLDTPAENGREYSTFTSDIDLLATKISVTSTNTGGYTITTTANAIKLAVNGEDAQTVTLTANTLLETTPAQTVVDALNETWPGLASEEGGAVVLTAETIDVQTVTNDAYTVLGFTVGKTEVANKGGQLPRFIRAEPASSGTNLLVAEVDGEEVTHLIEIPEIIPVRIEKIKSTTTVARVQVYW